MSGTMPDQTLDLGGVPCPLNFVKAKLRIEGMEAGQVLELFLDDGEPIKNVPRSLREEGHQILLAEQVGSRWRLLVRKT